MESEAQRVDAQVGKVNGKVDVLGNDLKLHHDSVDVSLHQQEK